LDVLSASQLVEGMVCLKRATSTSSPRQSSGTKLGNTGGPSSDDEQEMASALATTSPKARLGRRTDRPGDLVRRHAAIARTTITQVSGGICDLVRSDAREIRT
jgi:hypothetical protein